MDLKIYDGQHGTMIFPPADSIENEKIKRFFNEKIELYIEKKDNDITLYCKIYALKTADRVEIPYIVYSDVNNQDYFTNFKNEVDKALNELGLKLVFNKDTDNIIFKNIQLFNNQPPDISSFKDFIDTISLMNKEKRLELKTGSINDIIMFCKELLKNYNSINIGIFTGDIIGEGNVNILLDKRFDIPLSWTDNTKKILDGYKDKIKKKEREEVKRRTISDTTRGLANVIRELDAVISTIKGIEKTGSDKSEIEENADVIKLRTMASSRLSSIGGREGQKTVGITMMATVVLAMLIGGIIIGIVIQPYLSSNLMKNFHGKYNIMPTVMPTTPTVISTPKIVAVPTSTPGATMTSIPNVVNTNGTNNTNNTNSTNGTNNTNNTNSTNGTNTNDSR